MGLRDDGRGRGRTRRLRRAPAGQDRVRRQPADAHRPVHRPQLQRRHRRTAADHAQPERLLPGLDALPPDRPRVQRAARGTRRIAVLRRRHARRGAGHGRARAEVRPYGPAGRRRPDGRGTAALRLADRSGRALDRLLADGLAHGRLRTRYGNDRRPADRHRPHRRPRPRRGLRLRRHRHGRAARQRLRSGAGRGRLLRPASRPRRERGRHRPAPQRPGRHLPRPRPGRPHGDRLLAVPPGPCLPDRPRQHPGQLCRSDLRTDPRAGGPARRGRPAAGGRAGQRPGLHRHGRRDSTGGKPYCNVFTGNPFPSGGCTTTPPARAAPTT